MGLTVAAYHIVFVLFAFITIFYPLPIKFKYDFVFYVSAFIIVFYPLPTKLKYELLACTSTVAISNRDGSLGPGKVPYLFGYRMCYLSPKVA